MADTFASYTDRNQASRASEAALKARYPARYVDGQGVPPGKQHWPGTRLPSGQGYTEYAESVRTGSSPGEWFVRSDDSLPDEAVDIDGVLTRPPRGGEELTRDDFNQPPVFESESRT